MRALPDHSAIEVEARPVMSMGRRLANWSERRILSVHERWLAKHGLLWVHATAVLVWVCWLVVAAVAFMIGVALLAPAFGVSGAIAGGGGALIIAWSACATIVNGVPFGVFWIEDRIARLLARLFG